jgi:hypothetical protein
MPVQVDIEISDRDLSIMLRLNRGKLYRRVTECMQVAENGQLLGFQTIEYLWPLTFLVNCQPAEVALATGASCLSFTMKSLR